MQYSVVKTDNNPIRDYFAKGNPSYHQTIINHYVQTIDLAIDANTSVLLTEFRKSKSKRVDTAMLYFCGFDDNFYHFHLFRYDKKDFDVIVVEVHGFGYNKKISGE